MWAIENETRFAVERTFVRDRDGAEIFLAAVRATFDLYPDGTVQVAKNQIPVALFPQYHGAPGESSLRWDSDLPRTKQRTDLLLNASAHVPVNQDDAHELPVGFRVGTLQKQLTVLGIRRWEKSISGLVTSAPLPFRRIPIRYEFALGGKPEEIRDSTQFIHGDRNPVGIGLVPSEGQQLPCIYNANDSRGFPDSRRPVAGFGAVAGHWSPRRQLAGTYDAKWQKEKRPLVPDDFQDAWFQAAPQDQIVPGYLRGGELVELTNLTPAGSLRFHLPRHSFGFRTSIGGTQENHRSQLHTVLIEPDDQRLTMVWHTALACHHTLYTLKRSVVFEKSRLDDREEAA